MKKYITYGISALFISFMVWQGVSAAGLSLVTQSMMSFLGSKAVHVGAQATVTVYPSAVAGQNMMYRTPETAVFVLDAQQDISTPGHIKAVQKITSSGQGFENFSFESRIDGDTVYVKIPGTFMGLFSENTTVTSDIWMRIGPSDVAAAKKEFPFVQFLHDTLVSVNAQPAAFFSAHQTDWLRFTQSIRLKPTGVKGVSTMTLDKVQLRKALVAHEIESVHRALTKTELKEIDTDLASYNFKNGVFTFVPNSMLPAKISGTIEYLDSTHKKITRTTNFTLTFSEYNVPVTVTVPSGFKSAAEVIKKFFQQGLEDAKGKSSAAGIKASMANFRAQAELVYDETNSYGTKANDGSCGSPNKGSVFNPGGASAEGVKQIFADAKKYGATSMRCNSTTSEFAWSSKVSDGTYWCVDSQGSSKPVSKNVTGTVCK